MIDAPNPVDVHVGRRVRLRRRELGVSQAWLADRLGLTFQQIQKYERGANRISASKLYAIAKLLEVPITYFFEGLDDPATPTGRQYAQAFTGVVEELLAEPNGPQLAEAFLSIRRRSIRKGLAELAPAIAANDQAQAPDNDREAAQ
ncbi:transcriptional regulator, Cro/CI family (plasmid) [Phenylobacterium zucineum HLK1]|mgnify:CR=1 FL=1|jgi:transcriptional regulator with XRE-family HTH domain|uniref:Transcriptional regulator, Cro/CI family n=2 Tax=Phenylobacterium TaxID=20 RepID=B4RIK0_PHEZH|nr:helix-turn-helix transcriptional regulator [Phenylobacterium zucineum]ACG80175.1 transcriptional regulator, Cro/CI family [Phenylobacterium zucineum HLK1]